MEIQSEPILGYSTEAASDSLGRPSRPRTLSVPSAPPISSPSVVVNERQPLLRRRSYDGYHDTVGDAVAEPSPVAGGTVLGIHNLAIVFPQFIVSSFLLCLLLHCDNFNYRLHWCPAQYSTSSTLMSTNTRNTVIHTLARMVLLGSYVSVVYAHWCV